METQKHPRGAPRVNALSFFIARILMSYYAWQPSCVSEEKSYIFSAARRGQKENFHFYSQAICYHCCWRCRNNTGVGAKNKTAVYLPLLEPEKLHAQRSGAAACFSERCHSSLYLISPLLLSPTSPSSLSPRIHLGCFPRLPWCGLSPSGRKLRAVVCPVQV